MTTVNSLCIPRVFTNITPERVRKVFDEISIFTIDKIDMIKKENDKENEVRFFPSLPYKQYNFCAIIYSCTCAERSSDFPEFAMLSLICVEETFKG